MAEVFDELMQQSMSRGVAEAELRVWAPQGAQVLFVRQVVPERRGPHRPPDGAQPAHRRVPDRARGATSRATTTSASGCSAKAIGQEQLAARVQLAVGGEVRRRAWSRRSGHDDEELTTRINPEVAHYTGQTELAQAIQEGLAAKAAGDDADATTKLGRAVQLAAQTGNEEATTRLRKVVDIDNVETGTVRLKRAVDKADEMALDTASTKTTRVRALMSAVCPAGHTSTAEDYCDVCGMPIDTAVAGPSTPPLPTDLPPESPRRDRGRSTLSQLRDGERGRGTVLRGLRLRLHHRQHAPAQCERRRK